MSIMILADSRLEGEKHAIANQHSRKNVFVPGSITRVAGVRFTDFIEVGRVALSYDEYLHCLRTLLPNAVSPVVHRRLRELVTHG